MVIFNTRRRVYRLGGTQSIEKFWEGRAMKKSFSMHLTGLIVGVFFLFGLLRGAPAGAVTIDEYLTPTPESSPTDLAFDAKGNLWFTEINGNRIGRLDPSQAEPGSSKGIVEYSLPQKNSKPNNIIVAKNGMVWFTEIGGPPGGWDQSSV